MKVLHMVSHLNSGGITSYLFHLLPEQKTLGHQVYVWGAKGDRVSEMQALAEEVFDTVPYCKSELSPRLWMALPGLISILREYAFNVIHAHTRVTQVLAETASHLVQIPYVTTAHGFYKPRLGRKVFPCWGREIFAISNSVRDGLLKTFGVGRLPYVQVVPNGIDVEWLHEKVALEDRDNLRGFHGYSPDDIVVLSLSRLRPSKGIHILVSAFSEAHKKNGNLKLLLVGGGDEAYRKELQTEVDGLGLSSAVQFVGNCYEIERPLAAADIFAAPYLSPEGFGLSVLEAMAAGLPVIASRIDGLIELLDEGKRGILFEEKDIAGLAEGLLKYASDSVLRNRMAAAARDASVYYSSSQMAELIQEGYERAVAHHA